MFEAIHYENGALIDMQQYLRRHDVIYRRPALRGCDGLPIGTGCAGGLVYHTPNGIELTVNHADAIDFAPDGRMQAWAWEAEERNTAPVSCGKVSIASTLPIFDWMYLDRYEERLNLADACVEGTAITPFSKAEWRIFAPADPGVIVMELDLEQAEEAALTVTLDKWPSPNFFHHYEQILRIHDKNLSAVRAEVRGEHLIVRQDLGRCNTALAVRCEAGVPKAVNSRTVQLRFPKQRHHRITLYLCARSEEGGDAADLAMRAIRDIDANELWTRHHAHWQSFWNKSFVHLDGEDYLENLYYIHLYQMGCGSRGRYPLTFSGLWGWFRDCRNWGHFYHWNHQQNYWGLLEAGHPELCENYLQYRYDMLPQAINDARDIFGARGAFYSDISNFNGYNAIEPDTVRNLSVGAQISLDFYRYYRYTGDEAFLKEKALPVMVACAEFYLDMLEADESGELLLKGGSTAYESYWNLKKSITDQAMIRALLHALKALNDTCQLNLPAEQYESVLQNLYSAQTVCVEHNGEALEIFSAGESWSGEILQYAQGEYPLAPFPAALMAPVYPSEQIGPAQKGSKKYTIMRNTARVLLDREIYALGALGCSGHSPAPQMAARLEMREDMIPILRKFATAYQIFPNGLMHFADLSQNQQWSQIDRPQILEPDVKQTQWEKLHDKQFGNRTAIEADWFLHCYFEAAANLFTGMQEMLMQSQGGVIRVFPALPEGHSAMFTLWAEDGYRVTSECVQGDIRYIEIFSTKSRVCKLALPWPSAQHVTLVHSKQKTAYKSKNGILSFPAESSCTYLLYRSEFPPENYYHNRFEHRINSNIKVLEKVSIGLDAYY